MTGCYLNFSEKENDFALNNKDEEQRNSGSESDRGQRERPIGQERVRKESSKKTGKPEGNDIMSDIINQYPDKQKIFVRKANWQAAHGDMKKSLENHVEREESEHGLWVRRENRPLIETQRVMKGVVGREETPEKKDEVGESGEVSGESGVGGRLELKILPKKSPQGKDDPGHKGPDMSADFSEVKKDGERQIEDGGSE
ncbi:MAG: hypothetical protein KF789_00985 [Bdellovibrionaceae bacterium]|nr:hypothetical protein [Pseudobdellovibrionaceae bacterium]